MSSELNIESSEKNYIELQGVIGQFRTPHSRILVSFFSTYANSEGEYGELLDQLKPMRERLKSRQLKSMSALLQRDLNDLRISQELIPYLQNMIPWKKRDENHVAFFPAILSALIPKNLISESDRIGQKKEYPHVVVDPKDEDHLLFEIEGEVYWTLKKWRAGKKPTPLARLKIDPKLTSIIVLDGQHRANAFRLVTNRFFNTEDKSEIVNTSYRPFYGDVEFDAVERDLPVTIIWFEKAKENTDDPTLQIDPNLISRDLFIAVNNNARKISRSRMILLDDNEPLALMTQFFYSGLAEKYSFEIGINEEGNPSLLHFGFDINQDLQKNTAHAFTIAMPEIIYAIHEWFFMRHRTYTSVGKYSVERLRSTLTSLHLDRFFPKSKKYVKVSAEINDEDELSNDQNAYFVGKPKEIEGFRDEYSSGISSAFLSIFEKLQIYQLHFHATKIVDNQYKDGGFNSDQNIAWRDIFNGGEGLYYALQNLNPDSPKTNQSAKNLQRAVSEIENLFRAERARLFGNEVARSKVDECYRSAQTKAFLIGLFMAFYSHQEKFQSDSLWESAARFVADFNKRSPIFWVSLLTDGRRAFTGSKKSGTTPKDWPMYHKLILRSIQTDFEFYKEGSQNSPEARLYALDFKRQCRRYSTDEGIEEYRQIPIGVQRSFGKKSTTRVTELFEKTLGLKLLGFDKKELESQVIDGKI